MMSVLALCVGRYDLSGSLYPSTVLHCWVVMVTSVTVYIYHVQRDEPLGKALAENKVTGAQWSWFSCHPNAIKDKYRLSCLTSYPKMPNPDAHHASRCNELHKMRLLTISTQRYTVNNDCG